MVSVNECCFKTTTEDSNQPGYLLRLTRVYVVHFHGSLELTQCFIHTSKAARIFKPTDLNSYLKAFF